MTLWEVDIHPATGQPDRQGARLAVEAAELGLADQSELRIHAARGYVLQGTLDDAQARRLANELLADQVVEQTVVAPVGDPSLDLSVTCGSTRHDNNKAVTERVIDRPLQRRSLSNRLC